MTCPSFRTRSDADIARKIYKNTPVLENENTNKNQWKASLTTMFHMSNDSHLFEDRPGSGLLRLYESKMFHIYNHRFANAEPPKNEKGTRGSSEKILLEELIDPNIFVKPRNFVRELEVSNRLKNDNNWLLAVRAITGVVSNERTIVAAVLPKSGLSNSAVLISIEIHSVNLKSCFLANFNSLVFDYKLMCI